jgi:hypothetical protein
MGDHIKGFLKMTGKISDHVIVVWGLALGLRFRVLCFLKDMT